MNQLHYEKPFWVHGIVKTVVTCELRSQVVLIGFCQWDIRSPCNDLNNCFGMWRQRKPTLLSIWKEPYNFPDQRLITIYVDRSGMEKYLPIHLVQWQGSWSFWWPYRCSSPGKWSHLYGHAERIAVSPTLSDKSKWQHQQSGPYGFSKSPLNSQ